MIDVRLYQLPDRMEVIQNMDVKTRGTPLSSMQLWEVEDGPVVIERDGTARIFCNDVWSGMDPWETVFNGHPLSFKQFQERWPSLVSESEFISSFTDELQKNR